MSQKQAKRRRREERTKAQQEASSQNGAAHEEVIDLEDLIEAGNIDEYARACWSLANETEGTPKAGDVITDFGPCEEHGSHEYRFRLTLQSAMTIAQCTGMDTGDEATRLVASKLPPESLPCYAHGHGEQFRDYVTYGMNLTNVCTAERPQNSPTRPRASTGPAKSRSRESTERSTKTAPIAVVTCWNSKARNWTNGDGSSSAWTATGR